MRPAELAVVVDVLRATSTIVQALAVGHRCVLCVESVEGALALRGPGRVLAGERGGLPPPGFDLGNSPAAIEVPAAEELVLATTNGSPTIVRAAEAADTVLIGALINLEALARTVVATARDVLVVCSGTDGRFALEDAYVAGRLCAELSGERSDAALAAERIARTPGSALETLRASADARALDRVGLADDVAWCARESVTDVVPRVESVRAGVATVLGNS